MKRKTNLYLLGSIALNIALLIMLFKGCGCPSCDVESVVTTVKADTAYLPPDTTAARIVARPKPKKVMAYVHKPGDTVYQSKVECLDTAEYCDEYFEKDNYRAYVYETVTGNRLVDRRIIWYNLKPIEQITVTKETVRTIASKEKIRVYLGLHGGYRQYYMPQPNISKLHSAQFGPSILATIPKGVAIGYDFDGLNNGHTVRALYLIKFTK